MNKNDLKSGDIVKTREGKKYIVLLNTKYEDVLVNLSSGLYLDLEKYKENLSYERDLKCYDIVAICGHDYPGDNLMKHGLTDAGTDYTWTWERNEPKKMTVSEICKELGYEVEIIKEN